jgi:predicted ArsR family transcriptional regulator
MTDTIFNRALLLVTSSRFLTKEYGDGILDAITDYKNTRTRRQWAEIAQATGRSDPEYLYRLFTDKVHEYHVIRKTPEALEVKVTRCAHADAFKTLNATDIGYKMICMGDHAVAEGFNPKIRFTRPKTIMAGDDICHFVFELDKAPC